MQPRRPSSTIQIELVANSAFGTGDVAAAWGSAISDATGQRLRDLPLNQRAPHQYIEQRHQQQQGAKRPRRDFESAARSPQRAPTGGA